MTWTERDVEREMRRLEVLRLFRQARVERQRQDPILVQYDLQQRLIGKPGLWPGIGNRVAPGQPASPARSGDHAQTATPDTD